MQKINIINNLKLYENNIYKIDKSIPFYNDFNNSKTSYFKPRNMILPKHTEVHPEVKWLNELESRYCNLYKNAPLILGFISDYLPDSFKEEVYERTGFKPNYDYLYCSDITLKDYRGLSVLEILEDYMLGYDTGKSGDLEKIIISIRKHPELRMDDTLKHFSDVDPNIGFSKFDEAFKLLLDLVYSFVLEQKESGIKGASKTPHGYQVSNSFLSQQTILSKLDVLDRYYSILAFRNSYQEPSYNLKKGLNSITFTKGFSDKRVIYRFSLVDSNRFLNALSYSRNSFGDVIRLGPSFKEKIYFKFHDEIPRYHNAICNKIHDVEDGCDTEFYPKEEDIFYLGKKFITICPCCGGRVTTGVLSREHKSKIEARIKKRCLEDDNLDRKLTLLSELIKIGGTSYNKGKIKEKK